MNRFDEMINRYNTGSIKYDYPARFGKPEGLLPLWVADMDFQTADVIKQALVAKAEYGIYGYSDAGEGYYNALQSWFSKRHDFLIEKEQVVKTPGIVFAISAAVRAYTKAGEAVMIQQPVYHPFESCVTENKRKLINNELCCKDGRYTMDLADFEAKIVSESVKMFILCSPHNPVGRVWTKEELKAVGDICLRHNVFVISDEIHCDFVWEENKHCVFAGISEEFAKNSMICTAPSKTFNLAGLQVSNILIADRDRRESLKREIFLTGYDELNVFALAACEAAYGGGEAWLEELKEYLWGNIGYVQEFVREHIKELKVIKPEGTYLLWIDFSGLGMIEEEIGRLVEKAGLWLNDGKDFGSRSGQFMRLNTACPRTIIEQAMKQLKEAVLERERI